MKLLIFILFLFPLLLNAQELPEGFYQTEWDLQFDRPISIHFDQADNTFIVGKSGLIWKVDADGSLQNELVLDITEEVADWGDHGLVGFAFDPDYQTNQLIYVYYTVDRHHLLHFGSEQYDPNASLPNQATIGRVAKYRLEYVGDLVLADPSSRQVIFGNTEGEGNPILMASHGVGTLTFGGDGSLLLSSGDGGSYTEVDIGNALDTYHEEAIQDGIIKVEENVGSLRSMMQGSLAGKIIRIDPNTGFGLPNNPYFDPQNPNAKSSKVYATGFRNPYKIMHVPGTSAHDAIGDLPGDILVGDVGSAYWEELNLVNKPGRWHGWPRYEGFGGNWNFENVLIPNTETINSLAEQCGMEYFNFFELIQQENREDEYEYLHPCNENVSLPDSFSDFVHRRPIMAYSNDKWNPPAKTMVGRYDSEGRAIQLLTTEAEAEVEGEMIEGGSILPAGFCTLENFPEEYKGKLFLLDYHGYIYTAGLDELYQLNEVLPFARFEAGITDMKFNVSEGVMYYVNHTEGKIRKIGFGGVRPPLAVLESDVYYGASPLEVSFLGEGSESFDESQLSYQWLKDGELVSDKENPVFTFESDTIRRFEIKMIVQDTSGNMAFANQTIHVNNTPPLVEILSPKIGSTYSQTTTNIFELEAESRDEENQNLEFRWQVNFHHNDHVHKGSIDYNPKSYALIEPAGCGLEEYYYKIILNVQDEGGLMGTDSLTLLPYCGEDFSEFSDLSVRHEGVGVRLDWEIEIEDGVIEYQIEKTQEKIFKTIGSKIATGMDQYNFLDRQVTNGLNYYRIKSIHQDGHIDYSKVVSIHYTPQFGFLFSPNPFNNFNELSVLVTHPELQNIKLSLYSIDGKLIHQQDQNISGIETRASLRVDLEARYTGNSGALFYRLVVNGAEVTGRLVKL